MINLLRIIVAQLENRDEPMTKAQMSKALGKSRSYIYNLVEKGASDELLNMVSNQLIDRLCYRTDMEAITAELSKQLSSEKKQSYVYDEELKRKNAIMSTYEKTCKQQKRQYDQSVESYNISVQQRKGLEEENANLYVEIKKLDENKEILRNCINKKEDALLKEIDKHKDANERIGILITEIGTLKFQIESLSNANDHLQSKYSKALEENMHLEGYLESQKDSLTAMSEAGISTGNALKNMRYSRNLWFIVSLLCVVASLFGFFYHAV